jgi:hypothetical protein
VALAAVTRAEAVALAAMTRAEAVAHAAMTCAEAVALAAILDETRPSAVGSASAKIAASSGRVVNGGE